MFPDYLDNAKVLEYTDKGHYGFVSDYDENSNPIQRELCYFAIAQYDGDSDFYLFGCDESYEVWDDTLWWTLELCKTVYPPLHGVVWHKK